MARIHKYALATAAVALLSLSMPASAQQKFKSPEEAVSALVAAARAGDSKKIVAVLGPAGRAIASSGDEVADNATRAEFLAKYEAKNQIVLKDDSNAELLIGSIEWPLPIPIVKKDGAWIFDAVAGRKEILARRIGRNELDAIQACLAYVDAQNEYAEINPQRNGAYARRVISSTGKRDGLYWPNSSSEQMSPLGEAIAFASAEGYRKGKGRTPYHGYYYSILSKQGPDARGGRADYVVNGNMIGGFALVAYPAEYRNSGVMTFVVNHDGDVFQKDLGPLTAQIAGQMTVFNPDLTWTKVDIIPVQ